MSLKPVSSSSSSASSSCTVNTPCPFKDVSYDSTGTGDLNCTTDGSSQESTLPFRKRRKTATQQSSTSLNTSVTNVSSNLVTASTSDVASPVNTLPSGTSSPQPLLSSSNDLMAENESESNSHENSPANDIINQILENLDNKSIEGTGSNGSPKGDDDLAGAEDDLSNLISESDADEILKQLHSTDPDSVVDSVGVGVESSDTISSQNSSSVMGLGAGSDEQQSQSKLPPMAQSSSTAASSSSLTNESNVHQPLHEANVNALHTTNTNDESNLNTLTANVSSGNAIYSSTESHTTSPATTTNN